MPDPDEVKEDEDEVEDPDAPVVVNTEAVTVNADLDPPVESGRPTDHPDDEDSEGEDEEGTDKLVPYDQDG
jgi:hypothetical protein